MEVTNARDAPASWRSKMALSEVVDSGISFEGGHSSGVVGINRYQQSQNANQPNGTRPKMQKYLRNNFNSGMRNIRNAGKRPGLIYN